MKIIKKLAKQVDEEVSDAEKYARCAAESRSERPALAQTYLQLANAELEHAQLLHNSVVGIIEEERRTNGDPPAGMLEAYEMLHEWQMERVANVRALIQSVRE